MQKATALRIAFTLFLLLGSFATPVLADGGGPVPLARREAARAGTKTQDVI